MRVSIRQKITLMFLGLIVIAVSALGYLNYNNVKETVVHDFKRKGLMQLKNVDNFFLKNFMADMEYVVNRWAEDPEIVNYVIEPGTPKMVRSVPKQFEPIANLWNGYVTSNSDIAWLYLGNEKDGSLYLEPLDPTMPLDYDCRSRQWYQSTVSQNGKVIWTEPYLDAGDSGEIIVTVAKSVQSGDRLVGVVGMDIKLKKFSEIIQNLEFVDGGSLMLIGNDGYIFAHPNQNMLTKDLKERAWAADVFKNDTGSYITTLDDQDVVVSYLSVSNTEWKLVGISPVHLESALDPIRNRTLQVAFISILITFMIGYFLSINLTRPVRNMMTTIGHVSKGNMNVRAKIKSNDEFQVLGDEFNGMLEKLSVLIKERDGHVTELVSKNQEILDQKQEILQFSEETEAMNEELTALVAEIRNNYLSTVRVLANAIEASDQYTGGHCDRVKSISISIANELKLSDSDKSTLEFACLLHDIGKIGIPNSLLNKEGRLTEEEYDFVRTHPEIGFDILKDVDFLKTCSHIMLQHHERIDGKGYPQGIKGESIDILARILAVADAYDAMTSVRPYRKRPLEQREAMNELLEGKGSQFDDQVVDAFVNILQEKPSRFDVEKEVVS